MRPRVLALRFTAVLAAYAIAVAAMVGSLSVAAHHGGDITCLAGDVSPVPTPDQAPDSIHGNCGLCAVGWSFAPALALARQIDTRFSASSPQHWPEQVALPPQARAGPGLPRAPPHAA
jgi:hypothetical protein